MDLAQGAGECGNDKQQDADPNERGEREEFMGDYPDKQVHATVDLLRSEVFA
jgi:hypothetical protein